MSSISESNNKKSVDSTGDVKTPLVDTTSGSTESAGIGDQQQCPPPKEMKAVVLTGHGGLKGLRVQNRTEAVLNEGEVLIRVKAGGLGFPDLMLRQGAIDVSTKVPFTMGFECSGVIEEVGEGITDFKIGDRVTAISEFGAWAELVAIPAKHVYHIPTDLEWKEAVALTLNYVVAQALLFDVGNLRDGQTILVHSVGGGVGQAVAQLARTKQDITIIGTASKHKHEAIKDTVNYLLDHSVDYVAEIKKISPDGVDLVLDCLCGDDSNKGYNLLKPMGRYILYGTAFIVSGETKSLFSFAKSWWQVDKVSPLKLYDENRTISGFNLRKLLFHQDRHEYVRSLVETVYDLWRKKKICPILDSCWAFEDIGEAMQKMHDRRNVGKIVIDPHQEPKPRPPEPEPVESGLASLTGSIRKVRKASTKEKTSPVESKDVPVGNSNDIRKEDSKQENDSTSKK